LAAEEFDEAARMRAAVGAQQSHAVEKKSADRKHPNLSSSQTRRARLLFFDFGEKGNQSGVEFARERGDRRFFVNVLRVSVGELA